MIRPLAIVVALLTAIGAADSRTDRFSVGVMRRDGAVVPIASFDGKRWSVSWPGPALELQVPITLASVPKAWWGPTPPISEWQIWPVEGEPRQARVTRPDWIDAHCLRQVVLRTDYKSDRPLPPPTEQPYPKDGLVISPPRPIERIERVAPASAQALGLPEVVRKAFAEAETETAAQFTHPLKKTVRDGVDVTLEAIYTFGTSPRVYYVEAARGYRTSDSLEGDCALSFGTGWFAADQTGAIVRLDMAVDLLRCNRYGAAYMLPLGVIRLNERVFWVVQYSGWDQERFVVAEIKKDRVDAAVIKAGGGC
jgi:hypothetical protein